MPFGSGGATASGGRNRSEDGMVAAGFLSELIPNPDYESQSTVPSQRITATGVFLYSGEVVTNIVVGVGTAPVGTAPTACKVGLWNSAAPPKCLAVSADLSAAANWPIGLIAQPLTSPFTILTTAWYYATFLVNGAWGTTQLQLGSHTTNPNAVTALGAFPRRACLLSSTATDMAVNDTGAYSGSGSMQMLAVS